MTYLKVKDNTNLVRDSETGAIINSNDNEYKSYVNMREKDKHRCEKIDKLENDLNNIKNDINDIKILLGNLLK
jgi:predicted transcriptional regulator